MNSNQRILHLFFQLYQGKKLTIAEASQNYQVSKRTIQRDLSLIQEALAESATESALAYEPVSRLYTLQRADILNVEEVIAVGKILLESRSLTKNELETILAHLGAMLSPAAQDAAKRSFANELLDYYPLKHHEDLLPLIRKFTHYIAEHTVISFDYRKNRGQLVERTGLPVSLLFSEYYFYVFLYNPTYQQYLIYRLDRFGTIRETAETIKIPYKNRLQDSELRKKLYFMYAGKEVTFTFRFWGIVEAALDRLPGSKIEKKMADGSVIISATAFDSGVIMWLLSQGAQAAVLSPPSFVQKIKTEIDKMQKRYTD